MLRSTVFGRLEQELVQHNHEIARKPGYTDKEIEELVQQGVFG